MTTTTETTVWCDTCGGWVMVGEDSEEGARARLHENGWSYVGNKDCCPRCTVQEDPDYRDTFTRKELQDSPDLVMEAADKAPVTIVDEDGSRCFTLGTLSPVEEPSYHLRWPETSPYQ